MAFGYGTTFTVPDTTTQWPQTRENLTAAFQWGMAERFPQAFAALARDARATLDDTQRQHARQGERGEGWYLVARPARPDWPVTLEQAATEAAGHEPDLDAAAAELEQLRPLEAQETYPGPLGEALFEATRELGWLLHQQRPELVFNATVRQVIISAGPVVEQWRETLTPVSAAEQGQLTNSRRLARLLSSDISPQVEAEFHFVDNSRNQVNAMWRDHADRLVVELDEKAWNDELLLAMEWPTDLPDGWDDHTVIAGDAYADAVFALTSTKDGRLRADPLPNPAADPSYTWGYSGTGPSNLYDALVRCALGLWPSNSPGDWLNRPAPTGSELWAFITGTAKDGPIRLPWPQVQAWARADRKRAMRPT